MRYIPPPSASLKGLSVGLVLLTAMSERAIGGISKRYKRIYPNLYPIFYRDATAQDGMPQDSNRVLRLGLLRGFPEIWDVLELPETLYWRRGSESNRRPRLCRPLHNHSATPPLLPQPDGLVAPLQCNRETEKLKRENGFRQRRISFIRWPYAKGSIFPVTGAGNEARTRDPNLGKVVLYH
jgi:hypothetical protein